MEEKVIYTILLSVTISFLGMLIGTLIGIMMKKPSNRLLSNILCFGSGFMFILVFADLIPEALEWNVMGTLTISLVSIFILFLLDYYFSGNTNNHKKVAIFMAAGIMLHNFPEGLIMGIGFMVNDALGIKMAVMIGLHEVPEAMTLTAPMMAAKIRKKNIILGVFATFIPSILGIFIGVIFSSISKSFMGSALALASGVMAYVVFLEMLPEASKLYKGKNSYVYLILGAILASIIVILL